MSAPVLAREAGLGASADDSVCPLTRTTRELARCSDTDVFFFWRRAQRRERRMSSLRRSTASLARSPAFWSPAESTDSR